VSQRYPGQLELRAPPGATPLSLRMQAQTAARFEDNYPKDILAHATLTGAGSRDSCTLLPLWDQTRVWDRTRESRVLQVGGRRTNQVQIRCRPCRSLGQRPAARCRFGALTTSTCRELQRSLRGDLEGCCWGVLKYI